MKNLPLLPTSILAFLLLFSLLFFWFPREIVERSEIPPSPPPRTETPCPKLENRLYQLTQVANKEKFAKEQDIDYQNGKARVVTTLKEKAVLPTKYNLQVEAKIDRLVQVLVSVSDLCALSDEPEVSVLMAPLKPLPMSR